MITLVVSALLLSTGVSSARSDDGVEPGIEPLGGCVGNICGSVMNESNHTVWAIRNWGDSSSGWRALAPGQETPRNEDWDGFYVGCNASGRIAAWTPPGFWRWSDFTLSGGWMMQIHTHEDAHVRNQSC
jgi:hypothetical protein